MSWEPSPSVETHGSYGFGFFPQFSVGLVWPGTLSPCLRDGVGAAAGLRVAPVSGWGVGGLGLECGPRALTA